MHSQEKTIEFNQDDFNVRPEFYDSAQDSLGINYFANVSGLLIYDGSTWKLKTLKNRASITSIHETKSGEIIYGSYGDLGKVIRNNYGGFELQSYKLPNSPTGQKIENIWQIQENSKGLFAMASNQLILINQHDFSFIQPNNYFSFSYNLNDKILVQDMAHGLFELNEENELIRSNYDIPLFKKDQISSICQTDAQGLLITTIGGKVIYFKNGDILDEFSIKDYDSTDVITTSNYANQSFYLGSLKGKSYRFKLSQSKKLYLDHEQWIKKDASIAKINSDKQNLGQWYLTNNGLSFEFYKQNYSKVFDGASVFDIVEFHGQLYLGTKKGVFKQSSNGFVSIPGLEGQVWSFEKVGESLIISHHGGLYEIDGNEKINNISNIESFWKISKYKSNHYFASSYAGIYNLIKENGRWNIQGKIPGFNESSRDILINQQKNEMWVCHGYQGIFHLKLNQDFSRVQMVKHYTNQNGLENFYNSNVRLINNEIVFTTHHGIMYFDRNDQQFKEHEALNNLIRNKSNTTLIEELDNYLVLVKDNQLGIMNLDESNKGIIKSPFSSSQGKFNESMETIYRMRDDLLVGTNDGVYQYKINNESFSEKNNTILTKINFELNNGQIMDWPLSKSLVLPPKFKNLKIEFSSPKLGISKHQQFKYKLSPLDQSFSEWNPVSKLEFPLLNGGIYDLEIIELDEYGNESLPLIIPFEVKKIWYQKASTIIIFIAIIIILILLGVWKLRNYFEDQINDQNEKSRQKQRLLELEIQQLKLKQDKEEITSQKNKLEQNIQFQSQELMDFTMKLASKKLIMDNVYERIKALRGHVKTQKVQKELLSLQQEIKQNSIGEEQLIIFESQFEKVHLSVYSNLRDQYNEISTRELRLCAFIIMNLSNKEIAPLLNISVRGVESARYRISKKLKLKNKNLKTYLDELALNEAIAV